MLEIQVSTGSHYLLEQRLPNGNPREAVPGRMSELTLMSSVDTLRAVPTQVPTEKNPLSFQGGGGRRGRNHLEISKGSVLFNKAWPQGKLVNHSLT